MKKTTTIIFMLVLVLALLCVFVGCNSQDTNVLKTGVDNTFTYDDLSAVKGDWELSTASTATETDVFSIVDNSLVINTSTSGWAQATQSVNLKPNSYYMVEYIFTANNFTSYGESGFDGLFVSILEDEDFNTGDNAKNYRQIATTKVTERLYFKTTAAKKTTFAINVGSEDYPVSVSSVTISNVKLVKVPKSQVESEGASYFTFVSDTYSEASNKNIPYVVVGAIAIALLCYAAYVMMQRHLALDGVSENKFYNKLKNSKWLGVVIVALVAVSIRLLIDILVTCLAGTKLHFNLGYNVEGYAGQSLFIGNYGTVFLSESLSKFCTNNNYTYLTPEISAPLQLYVLGLAGVIGKLFGANQYLAATFFIKFFASLADVGTAVLIFTLLKKHVGNAGATIMSLLYVLLPLTFATSSLWGFTESITVFLIMLTFFFMLQNNYYGVVASYFAAFLFSWSAIIVAPIIVFYSIQQAINNKKLIIPIAVSTVVAFGLFYVLCLPFNIHTVKTGTAFACVVNYWNLIFKNVVYTANAFNFQSILTNNFATVSTESLIVTVIFILFLLTLVAIAYFKFKNRMNLMLLATAFINMMFVFGNGMSPITMYMSLALMLVYAIINKEKRVFFAFAAFAVLMFVNISVQELLVAYSATAQGIIVPSATSYVFSAFALVIVLYYIYIVYDIVVTRKVRRIQPMALTYCGWWKNMFKRLQKNYYKLRIKVTKQN